jgi:hypothetical protein
MKPCFARLVIIEGHLPGFFEHEALWRNELNQLSLLGTFGNINRAIGPIYRGAIDAGVGKIVVYAPL